MKISNTLIRAILFCALASMTAIFFSCDSGTTNSGSSDSTTVQAAPSAAPADTSAATQNNAMDTSSMNTKVAANGTHKMKKEGKRKVSVKLAPVDIASKMEMDKKGVYNRAEVRPEFPGGENALDAYLEREIQYPQPAIDNSTEGTVNVQFAVDEHGKISQAKETNTPLGDGLDDEALRVVENMPQWTPGKIKGKNVKTYYTLPIVFSIQ